MKPHALLLATLTLVVARAAAQSGCCAPHAGAGCDDATCAAAVCALDPFCCSVTWDARCAGEASVLCNTCRPAPGCTLPASNQSESEACGDTVDDPCGPTGGAPRPLPAGVVASGALWSTANARDVDWFEVTLAAPARLQVEIWSAGPIGAVIVTTPARPPCTPTRPTDVRRDARHAFPRAPGESQSDLCCSSRCPAAIRTGRTPSGRPCIRAIPRRR